MVASSQSYEIDNTISLPACSQMFKALGDETRVRMLGLLSHGELCVCDIMAVLELPQSTVSRHLAYLRNSDWVSGTRRGKWMYYRLRNDTFQEPVFQCIIEYICAIPQIGEDRRKLLGHLQHKDERQCS